MVIDQSSGRAVSLVDLLKDKMGYQESRESCGNCDSYKEGMCDRNIESFAVRANKGICNFWSDEGKSNDNTDT